MPAKKKGGHSRPPSASDDKPNQPDALDTNPMRSEQSSQAVPSNSPQGQSLIREAHVASSPATIAQQAVGTPGATAASSTATPFEPQRPAHLDPPASSGIGPQSATPTLLRSQGPMESTPRSETAQTKPATPSTAATVSSEASEPFRAAVTTADASSPKGEAVAAQAATPPISWSATGLEFTSAQRAAAAAGLPDSGAKASTSEPSPAAVTNVPTPLTASAVGAIMESARMSTGVPGTAIAASPMSLPQVSAPQAASSPISRDTSVSDTQLVQSAATPTQPLSAQTPGELVRATSVSETLLAAGLISTDMGDARIVEDRGILEEALGQRPERELQDDFTIEGVQTKHDTDLDTTAFGLPSRDAGLKPAPSFSGFAADPRAGVSVDGEGSPRTTGDSEHSRSVGDYVKEAVGHAWAAITDAADAPDYKDDATGSGGGIRGMTPEADGTSGQPGPGSALFARLTERAARVEDNVKASLVNPGDDEFGTRGAGVDRAGALPVSGDRLSPLVNPDPGDSGPNADIAPTPTFENTLVNPGPDLGIDGFSPKGGSAGSPGVGGGHEDD